MHMSDALLTPAVAGTMYAASAIAVGAAVTKIRKSPQSVKVAEAGVMGAFVFAAQMINFSIPGTGSSGHICGGMLLAAVLGPAAGFLTMAGVLLGQCLLFADGGILAYGANLWNMAFYGCMLGGGVFCMVCDIIARLAFAPVELNISTVTAVFGAPVVIYMMISRRRMR